MRGWGKWLRELDRSSSIVGLAIFTLLALCCGLAWQWSKDPTWAALSPVAATAIGLATFFLLLRAFRRQEPRRHYEIVRALDRPRGYAIFAATIAIGATFAIAMIGAQTKRVFLDPSLVIDTESLVAVVGHVALQSLMEPGGLLAIASGALAFVGLFVAARQLQEFRQVILTFPEFADRMIALVQEAEGDQTDGDYTRLLTFTPIPGSLALDQSQYRRVHECMHSANKISMIVLAENDLAMWLRSFEGKSRRGSKSQVTEGDTTDAIYAAEELIRSFDQPTVGRRMAFVNSKDQGTQRRPLRLVWEQFPGYYIVANRRAALVVCPLFFPLPAGSGRRGKERSEKVDMVGFETSDPKAVETIHELFDLLRTGIAEPPVVKAQDLEASAVDEFCRDLSKTLKTGFSEKQWCKLWFRGIGRAHDGTVPNLPPAGP